MTFKLHKDFIMAVSKFGKASEKAHDTSVPSIMIALVSYQFPHFTPESMEQPCIIKSNKLMKKKTHI